MVRIYKEASGEDNIKNLTNNSVNDLNKLDCKLQVLNTLLEKQGLHNSDSPLKRLYSRYRK